MNISKVTGIVSIEKPGPPDVLKYHTTELEELQAGEVLINQRTPKR